MRRQRNSRLSLQVIFLYNCVSRAVYSQNTLHTHTNTNTHHKPTPHTQLTLHLVFREIREIMQR